MVLLKPQSMAYFPFLQLVLKPKGLCNYLCWRGHSSELHGHEQPAPWLIENYLSRMIECEKY
jgi:hypothetical protein